MNVTCSSCNTQYKIDQSKVPPTGGFIKCKTWRPSYTVVEEFDFEAPAEAPMAPEDRITEVLEQITEIPQEIAEELTGITEEITDTNLDSELGGKQ